MAKMAKEKQVSQYEKDEKHRSIVKKAYQTGTVSSGQAEGWLMAGGWSAQRAKALVQQWREEAQEIDYYPERRR